MLTLTCVVDIRRGQSQDNFTCRTNKIPEGQERCEGGNDKNQ